MKHLYGKNRPAQAGIPVAETGIPARRDGTKNVPPPYKQYAIKTIETYTCRDPGHRPVPVNVPSRLSYKQALNHTMVHNSTRNTCMQQPLAFVSKQPYFPNMKYLKIVVIFTLSIFLQKNVKIMKKL